MLDGQEWPCISGVELLLEAKRLVPWVPVLLITGYGDVPTAVTALKAGAVDFIEKPLQRETFLRKVKSILQQQSTLTDSYLGRPLTANEVKILKLVVDGFSNKDIANLLKRSVRTIEVHRRRAMRKLGVDNLVDLVKRATVMELLEPPPGKEQDEAAEDSENSDPKGTEPRP